MMQDSKVINCTGCGAQVSNFVTYCPFCGLDMVKAKVDAPDNQQDPQTGSNSMDTDNLAGLYNPPYVARDKNGIGVGTSDSDEENEPSSTSFRTVAASPMEASSPAGLEELSSREQPANEEEANEEEPVSKGYLIPMSLMIVGSQLLTFALLIALFSSRGVLTLEWKTSTAVLFFILSIPLLTFGFKWLDLAKKGGSDLVDIRKR